MSRVKRGNVARARRKGILKIAKGYRGGLSKLYRPAHQVVLHALSYMYRDRRGKKRDFRALWIARINAAVGNHGVSYSKFMGNLSKKQVGLNRKVLSELAIQQPAVFSDIIEFANQ